MLNLPAFNSKNHFLKSILDFESGANHLSVLSLEHADLWIMISVPPSTYSLQIQGHVKVDLYCLWKTGAHVSENAEV